MSSLFKFHFVATFQYKKIIVEENPFFMMLFVNERKIFDSQTCISCICNILSVRDKSILVVVCIQSARRSGLSEPKRLTSNPRGTKNRIDMRHVQVVLH